VVPDPGFGIGPASVRFQVDGIDVPGTVTVSPATAPSAPAGTQIATLRTYSNVVGGVHRLRVVVRQERTDPAAPRPDSNRATAEGTFEVVDLERGGRPVRNLIVMIGDGMGIAHRTAARILLKGVSQGKTNGFLAMDTFPFTGVVITHSLNSIATDSSPGAACYATGNKSNNNQHGVFPDYTTASFDNPRVELLPEYLKRTRGTSLGIVTTSDVFDATPGAFGSHTQSRAAGTGIVDQYLDDRGLTGLSVLLGGGRKWFLPASEAGSARSAGTDYEALTELGPWGADPGQIDPGRDLIADFQAAGFYYAPDKAALDAAPAGTTKLLGLFSLSNMNIALDKVDGRRGNSAVVDDYGFPDQPMLDEMTAKALEVLSQNRRGFTLMVEAASIDKQAHNMDSERWILDTIEFDRAIDVAKRFAERNRDTLVIVTADHECAGVNIIGGSRVANADLEGRAASGGGAGQLRSGVVGTYESAGFPRYAIGGDGYPETTDVDNRMLIGYAANADRLLLHRGHGQHRRLLQGGPGLDRGRELAPRRIALVRSMPRGRPGWRAGAPPRRRLLRALARGPPGHDTGEDGDQEDDQPEPGRVLGERDAAHVHPEEAADHVEGQRQHRHHGEDEEGPVAALADEGGQFLLEDLDPLHERGRVGHRVRELLGGLAEVLEVLLGEPGRGAGEQAEEGGRLRGEEPLQAHQHPAQGPELRPARADPVGEKAVLDRVHPTRPVAGDPGQHLGLVAQEVGEEVGRGAERLALPHRLAQAVDRAQRLRARAHHEPPPHAQAERRGVGGVEGEVEEDVVEDRDQPVPGLLDAGRARVLVERLAEHVGQVEVLLHVAPGGRVRDVEVEPEEGARGGGREEPGRGLVPVHRPPPRLRLEEVPAHQPVLVGPVGRLRDPRRDGHRAQCVPRKKSWSRVRTISITMRTTMYHSTRRARP
jgi:alkaline phosphatase